MGGFECWEEGFFWGTVPVPEPSPDFSRVTRLTQLWGLEIQIFKSNFYTSRNHIIQKDMFPSSIKWWNFWTAKLYSNVYLNCDSHTVNKYNLFSSEYRLIPKQALEFLQLMQTFPICRAASNKKKMEIGFPSCFELWISSGTDKTVHQSQNLSVSDFSYSTCSPGHV